ncbi:hypothetical protein GRI99_01285 [Altererythrobacter buctensis]|uniref:Alginate export domain-containing protein n=1 Tax=Alteraurantiacibacter buctensis TaxID=1503981 RepID=A0A844YUU2_9SPHN|nr:hypothetical protein [Alteraurantiacibacter buctensis]
MRASARLRYEVLDGQPRAGFRLSEEQLDLRTTLFAEYRPGPFRIAAELYDSRAWLAKPGTTLGTGEVNTFELVQAYVGADLSGSAAIQAGRMTLNLGSRRLVAADDYRNTTNGYSGLKVEATLADQVSATAIYVLPQVRLPDDLPSLLDLETKWDRESLDLQLWGLLLSRRNTLAGATVEAGYFGLAENDAPGRPNRNRHLDTFSARMIRDARAGQTDFEVEIIYQTGSIRTSTAAEAASLPVEAWFVHAEAGYSFTDLAKLRLALEFDMASGDTPGGKFGRFDTLFGMRRADLAPAGLFNAVGRANIATLGLRAEIAPARSWDAFVTYRPMWLADRRDSFSTSGVRDPSGAAGRFAGHQLDGRLRYWLVPNVARWETNLVLLAKGRLYDVAPNSPGSRNTVYLSTGVMLTI